MSKLIFQGELKNSKSTVKVRLILFHFIDEEKNHIIYTPLIDLSGYGRTLTDAKKSFEIVLTDFFDYTIKKKTITKILKSYGWKIKGNEKKPKSYLSPDISDLIIRNDYVSEILNKYPVNTIHKEYSVPAFA